MDADRAYLYDAEFHAVVRMTEIHELRDQKSIRRLVMQELDKGKLDAWITREPKEEGEVEQEWGDVPDDIPDWWEENADEGPDPDVAYDQMREAREWGI